MDEILRRLDTLERNLNARHDAIEDKVDSCRLEIGFVGGEVRRIEQKVDIHAVAQSRERTEVNDRVAMVEEKVVNLQNTQAGIRTKLTALGALVGAAASEGVRRLFHQ